jgi:hypothetical protein
MKYLSPWIKEASSIFRAAASRAAISRAVIVRGIAAMLMFSLCGVPEVLAQAAQSSASSQTQQQQTAKPSGSIMPDPSQAPLQPVTSNLPDAPSATQQQNAPATQPPAPAETQPPPAETEPPQQQPLGAAAAEAATPTGGAASKPAGTAIAPAKQRQVRSLLIKLGVVAAAGVALGTVYGLSRGTSSLPPNASTSSTTVH